MINFILLNYKIRLDHVNLFKASKIHAFRLFLANKKLHNHDRLHVRALQFLFTALNSLQIKFIKLEGIVKNQLKLPKYSYDSATYDTLLKFQTCRLKEIITTRNRIKSNIF